MHSYSIGKVHASVYYKNARHVPPIELNNIKPVRNSDIAFPMIYTCRLLSKPDISALLAGQTDRRHTNGHIL